MCNCNDSKLQNSLYFFRLYFCSLEHKPHYILLFMLKTRTILFANDLIGLQVVYSLNTCLILLGTFTGKHGKILHI